MNSKLFPLVLFAGFIACNNQPDQTTETKNTDTTSTMKKFTATEAPYGSVDGQKVIKYTLSNPNGMTVSILNYGGIVTQIFTKDKNGSLGDVVLGYDSLAGYLQT